MIEGIEAKPVPEHHEFSAMVNDLCIAANVPPCLVYAIRLNETSEGDPPNVTSGDGGHGIMQLTSSFPDDWEDPKSNFTYAINHFIAPDLDQAVKDTGLQGDGLIRFVAAAYNAGYGTAIEDHNRGDVDAHTTNRYGERAVAHFHDLINEE